MEECSDYRNQLIVSLQSVIAIFTTLKLFPDLRGKFFNVNKFITDAMVALQNHDFNDARSKLANACHCAKSLAEWRTRDSFSNTLMASALKILKSAHQNGIDLLLVKCSMSSCLQSLPVEEATAQCAMEGAAEVIDEAFDFIHGRSASIVHKLLVYLIGFMEAPVEPVTTDFTLPEIGTVQKRIGNKIRGIPMFNEFAFHDLFDIGEVIADFENAKELTPQAMDMGIRALTRLKWVNNMRTDTYCKKYLAYIVDEEWHHHNKCNLCKFKIYHCYRQPVSGATAHKCGHPGCYNTYQASKFDPLTPESFSYLLSYYEARKTSESPAGFPRLDTNHFVQFWDKLHLLRKLDIAQYQQIRSITSSILVNPSILNLLTPRPRGPPRLSGLPNYLSLEEDRGFVSVPRGHFWSTLTPGEFTAIVAGMDPELIEILAHLEDPIAEDLPNSDEVPLENLDTYRAHYNSFAYRGSPRQATFLALFRADPVRANTLLHCSLAEQQDIVLSQRFNFRVTTPHPFMMFFNVRATDNNPVRLMETLRRAISDYNRLDVAPDYPIFL